MLLFISLCDFDNAALFCPLEIALFSDCWCDFVQNSDTVLDSILGFTFP